MRDRSVNLHRLARDPVTLLRRESIERAHVVQTIRELDQDHTDIPRHR